MISLNQAHQHICMLPSLQSVAVSLGKVLGLVCAEDVCAAVNCPSVDSSLKDGFAVVSADIADASLSNPVRLTVIGAVTAGENTDKFRVTSGTTVRIMTGAPLPQGTTSELASEFAQLEGKFVMIRADARAGEISYREEVT